MAGAHCPCVPTRQVPSSHGPCEATQKVSDIYDVREWLKSDIPSAVGKAPGAQQAEPIEIGGNFHTTFCNAELILYAATQASQDKSSPGKGIHSLTRLLIHSFIWHLLEHHLPWKGPSVYLGPAQTQQLSSSVSYAQSLPVQQGNGDALGRLVGPRGEQSCQVEFMGLWDHFLLAHRPWLSTLGLVLSQIWTPRPVQKLQDMS